MERYENWINDNAIYWDKKDHNKSWFEGFGFLFCVLMVFLLLFCFSFVILLSQYANQP